MEKAKSLSGMYLNADGTDWCPCPNCVQQYNWLVQRVLELGNNIVSLINQNTELRSGGDSGPKTRVDSER